MRLSLATVVLLATCGVTLAQSTQPATQPATQPSTRPVSLNIEVPKLCNPDYLPVFGEKWNGAQSNALCADLKKALTGQQRYATFKVETLDVGNVRGRVALSIPKQKIHLFIIADSGAWKAGSGMKEFMSMRVNATVTIAGTVCGVRAYDDVRPGGDHETTIEITLDGCRIDKPATRPARK